MTNNLDHFQRFGKEQLDAATSSSSSFVKSLQAMAAETADFSKKSMEDGAAFFEKLRGAKSFESAIQIQSEYAKASYEAYIARAKKIGETYTCLSKDAFKPIEAVIAKVQSAKESAKE
jgi:hypothetical protein